MEGVRGEIKGEAVLSSGRWRRLGDNQIERWRGGHDELADTATDFAASGDADALLKRGEEGTKTVNTFEQGRRANKATESITYA